MQTAENIDLYARIQISVTAQHQTFPPPKSFEPKDVEAVFCVSHDFFFFIIILLGIFIHKSGLKD